MRDLWPTTKFTTEMYRPRKLHCGESRLRNATPKRWLRIRAHEKNNTWEMIYFPGGITSSSHYFSGDMLYRGSTCVWSIFLSMYTWILNPRHSMHGTFTYIYHKNQPIVGKYTIHRVSGNVCVFSPLYVYILIYIYIYIYRLLIEVYLFASGCFLGGRFLSFHAHLSTKKRMNLTTIKDVVNESWSMKLLYL